MNKKQVASWIVTTVLIAGTGAALAGTGDPGSDATTDTTIAAADSTTTTVQDTTTTTVDSSTTTTVDESTTEAPDTNADVADASETGGGNSVAAQNHDCDEAWGNHGAWVAANAQAMKSGDEVSCDGPSTTASVDDTTSTTVATSDTVAPTADTSTSTVTETTTSSHGNSGHGNGHGKKK